MIDVVTVWKIVLEKMGCFLIRCSDVLAEASTKYASTSLLRELGAHNVRGVCTDRRGVYT